MQLFIHVLVPYMFIHRHTYATVHTSISALHDASGYTSTDHILEDK